MKAQRCSLPPVVAHLILVRRHTRVSLNHVLSCLRPARFTYRAVHCGSSSYRALARHTHDWASAIWRCGILRSPSIGRCRHCRLVRSRQLGHTERLVHRLSSLRGFFPHCAGGSHLHRVTRLPDSDSHFTPTPMTPNQAMQRTADRCAFSLSMTSTLNLQQDAPSPAVADLVSR